MKILNWRRGAGKTTALVRWAHDDPTRRVVIVATNARAIDLRRQHPDLRVMTAQSVAEGALRGFDHEITVDEVDAVLAVLLGRVPVAITMTADREPGPDDINEIPPARQEGHTIKLCDDPKAHEPHGWARAPRHRFSARSEIYTCPGRT